MNQEKVPPGQSGAVMENQPDLGSGLTLDLLVLNGPC